MKELKAILDILGLDDALATEQTLESAWEEFAASEPYNVPFLQKDVVRHAGEMAMLTASQMEDVIAGLEMFELHPELKSLAWVIGRYCQENRKDIQETGKILKTFPDMPEALHPLSGCFFFYPLMASLPSLEEEWRRCGIAEDILRLTLKDYSIWMDSYQQRHGRPGLSERCWFRLHMGGYIFRLGRLQFNFTPFNKDMHVLRHRETRRVVMLAGKGMKFRGDGQYYDADGLETDTYWEADYFRDDGQIIGYPISPDGAACPQQVILPAGEWEVVLESGSPSLGIHIPRDGGMDIDACGESFHLAREFFPKHFPDHPIKGYCCVSWLLDSQFSDILAPESNIRRFQEQFYLFPWPQANDQQLMDIVFGGRVDDWAAVASRSSLQKAIAAHYQAGRHIRGNGCIFLADQIDRWGEQPYRQDWAETWTLLHAAD